MALKDIWTPLQDAVAGVPNSGSDISAKPINDIADAVIELEENMNNGLAKKADKQNSSGGFEGGNKSIATKGGAIGNGTITGDGFAGGNGAKTIDTNENPIDAIQLGTGTNSTPKSLQVYNYQLMGADGNIPLERLNNAPKTEVVDSLESEDTTKALSASQGKLLNDKKANRDEMFEKLCPHTTISEYPVSITDHLADESVIDYKIYGNSVQDGTPSPDSPVDIVSVGDLVTDTASEYYGKYDVPVTVTGKNLLNTYGFSAESMNTPSSPRKLNNSRRTTISTINPSDSITITQVYNSAYSIESDLNGYFCIGINEEIKTGISYRISFDIDIISNPGNAKYIIIFPNGSSSTKFNLQEGRISGNFLYSKNSLYPNRRYIEFRCMGMSFTISNIMITYAENKDIEYEPYTSSNQHIYLDEPLRKVGDYADYIDFKNQKVIRQIEALDDTGTKSIEESYGTLDTPIEGSITIPELTTPISSVANISTETAISPSNMDVEYYKDINKVVNNLTNAILAQGGNV